MAAEPIAKRARASVQRICQTARSALDQPGSDDGRVTGMALNKLLVGALSTLLNYFQHWIDDATSAETQRSAKDIAVLLATAGLFACDGGDIVSTVAAFAPLYQLCQLITSALLNRAKKNDIDDAVRKYRAATAACKPASMMLEFVSLYYGVCIVIDERLPAALAKPGVKVSPLRTVATADDLAFLQQTVRRISEHVDHKKFYFPKQNMNFARGAHSCAALIYRAILACKAVSPAVWVRLRRIANMYVDDELIGKDARFRANSHAKSLCALFIRESLFADTDSSTDGDDEPVVAHHDDGLVVVHRGRLTWTIATDKDVAIVREMIDKVRKHRDSEKILVPHVFRAFQFDGPIHDCICLIVKPIKDQGVVTPRQWQQFIDAARNRVNGDPIGKGTGVNVRWEARTLYAYLVRRDVIGASAVA